LALNLIGSWGRAAEEAARSLGAWREELQVKRIYDVQMEAATTFAGDAGEGLHPTGSIFFTTESRADKYERNLPRLARRIGKVEVSSGTVKRRKPAIKPEEKKAKKSPAKKKAAAKKR
jgi:hypothetical protein